MHGCARREGQVRKEHIRRISTYESGCSGVSDVLLVLFYWGEKKKSDTQRLRWWKEMFCLLAELALTSVTFSSAPQRSGLFFILTGYKSACEIRDLLVPGAR